MKYAVVESGGKQYKVNEGQEILVDRLAVSAGENFNFEKILLIRTDDNVLIGNPYVAEAKVEGKVQSEVKGDKISVSKFKAKVRYRRKMGFRPKYSKVKIEVIKLTASQRSKVKKS